ncbi:hypothetical protein AAII07_59350, partial [Microvirga sp. 0TCS3.31]
VRSCPSGQHRTSDQISESLVSDRTLELPDGKFTKQSLQHRRICSRLTLLSFVARLQVLAVMQNVLSPKSSR